MRDLSHGRGDGAAHALADTAARYFLHLGAATRMWMDWQAKAAAMMLASGAERYWRGIEEAQWNYGPARWAEARRAQWLTALVPFEAWVDAVTLLQAVSAATLMREWESSATLPRPTAESVDRRRHSVIIPFPDRRSRISL